MSKHKELVEKAKAAIAAVANDTSVSPQTNLDSLEELAGEIEIYTEGLQESIADED